MKSWLPRYSATSRLLVAVQSRRRRWRAELVFRRYAGNVFAIFVADSNERSATRRLNSSLPLTTRFASTYRSSSFHQSNGGPRAGGDAGDSPSAGFNVRGMGMAVVVAQNFIPGTTAADIRAVFAPNKSQGLSTCRIVTASPTVIAELVFESQDEAESVVAKFNNKMVSQYKRPHGLADNPRGRRQTALCLPSA
jgi:hypothetical protein